MVIVQTTEDLKGEWGPAEEATSPHCKSKIPYRKKLGRKLSWGSSEFSFHQMPVGPSPRDRATSPHLCRDPHIRHTDPHIHMKKINLKMTTKDYFTYQHRISQGLHF